MGSYPATSPTTFPSAADGFTSLPLPPPAPAVCLYPWGAWHSLPGPRESVPNANQWSPRGENSPWLLRGWRSLSYSYHPISSQGLLK